MRQLIFVCSCLLLVTLAGCGRPITSQVRPDQLNFPPLEFNFPKVEKEQLANGMRLYLREDHELPLVELTIMVEGGSIYDPLDKVGLSQLFADTLGTGGAGDFSAAELENRLEAMAAELFVSAGSYSYRIDLSVHRDDLEQGLDLLADLLRRPRFDSERLELARHNMIEGIMRKNDDPGAIAGRLVAEAVNPGHPFGVFPTVADVEKMTRDDLLALHRRYFHPANIWLAVSGDVAQDRLIAMLDSELGDWPSGTALQRSYPPLPTAPAGRILIADKDIPQTTILMGQPGISKDNPDSFALRVANYIMGGGGFNSRMMREIRSNRGLAYSVYSYFQIGRHLPELFLAGSETKCGSTVEVVGLMQRIMAQMIDQPVSAEELELAKKSLVNSFVFAFEDSHSVVTRKVRLDFYGYPDDYMETYQQKIAAVTVEDVQRVARQYLHPGQLQIVLVGDSAIYEDAVKGLGLPVEEVDLQTIQ